MYLALLDTDILLLKILKKLSVCLNKHNVIRHMEAWWYRSVNS